MLSTSSWIQQGYPNNQGYSQAEGIPLVEDCYVPLKDYQCILKEGKERKGKERKGKEGRKERKKETKEIGKKKERKKGKKTYFGYG
jgi:hypothetical protein